MTKADLVKKIAERTGVERAAVLVTVEELMNSIKSGMANGENVYLRGFGSFISKTRKAKIARNISQSTSIRVPEHQIAAFKPAAEFAQAMRAAK